MKKNILLLILFLLMFQSIMTADIQDKNQKDYKLSIYAADLAKKEKIEECEKIISLIHDKKIKADTYFKCAKIFYKKKNYKKANEFINMRLLILTEKG